MEYLPGTEALRQLGNDTFCDWPGTSPTNKDITLYPGNTNIAAGNFKNLDKFTLTDGAVLTVKAVSRGGGGYPIDGFLTISARIITLEAGSLIDANGSGFSGGAGGGGGGGNARVNGGGGPGHSGGAPGGGGAGGYNGYDNTQAGSGAGGNGGMYDGPVPPGVGGGGAAGGFGQDGVYVVSGGVGTYRINNYGNITITNLDTTSDVGAGGDGGAGGAGGKGLNNWSAGGGGGGGGAGISGGGKVKLIATDAIIIKSGAIIRCNATLGSGGSGGASSGGSAGGPGGQGGSSGRHGAGGISGAVGGYGKGDGGSGSTGLDGFHSNPAGAGGWSGQDAGGGSIILWCKSGPISIIGLNNNTLQAMCYYHSQQFSGPAYQPSSNKIRSGVIKLFHSGSKIYTGTTGLTNTGNNLSNAGWIGENNTIMIGLLH